MSEPGQIGQLPDTSRASYWQELQPTLDQWTVGSYSGQVSHRPVELSSDDLKSLEAVIANVDRIQRTYSPSTNVRIAIDLLKRAESLGVFKHLPGGKWIRLGTKVLYMTYDKVDDAVFIVNYRPDLDATPGTYFALGVAAAKAGYDLRLVRKLSGVNYVAEVERSNWRSDHVFGGFIYSGEGGPWGTGGSVRFVPFSWQRTPSISRFVRNSATFGNAEANDRALSSGYRYFQSGQYTKDRYAPRMSPTQGSGGIHAIQIRKDSARQSQRDEALRVRATEARERDRQERTPRMREEDERRDRSRQGDGRRERPDGALGGRWREFGWRERTASDTSADSSPAPLPRGLYLGDPIIYPPRYVD